MTSVRDALLRRADHRNEHHQKSCEENCDVSHSDDLNRDAVPSRLLSNSLELLLAPLCLGKRIVNENVPRSEQDAVIATELARRRSVFEEEGEVWPWLCKLTQVKVNAVCEPPPPTPPEAGLPHDFLKCL